MHAACMSWSRSGERGQLLINMQNPQKWLGCQARAHGVVQQLKE